MWLAGVVGEGSKPCITPRRYREDVLSVGQIGGKCELDKKALTSQLDHKSPLQSW